MPRTWSLLCVIGLSLPLSAARGDEPQVRILKEVWEAAYLEGQKAGHLHHVFREITAGQRKLIEATAELELNLTRFNQQLKLQFAMGNTETPDGRVLGLAVSQTLSRDQRIVRKGRVEGKELIMQIHLGNAPPRDKRIPWSDNNLGLYAEETLWRVRKPQPGDKFDYVKFVPEFDSPLTVHVAAKDFEEVELLGGARKKLLRVENSLDKIQGVQFPPEVLWLDEQWEPVKRQMELPGLGRLTTYRTTKELALAPPSKAPLDVGIHQLVKLNRPLQRPNDTREIVYRFKVEGATDAETLFPKDDRQEVRKAPNGTPELVVRGPRGPRAVSPLLQPPAEYLKSNHFIRSDDPLVKELARKATGQERSAWTKALRIEKWVHDNVKDKNFTQAFATADQVARTLEGDCTEHAILASAMCRAAGVPARPVIGLVYVPSAEAMGYHMWIEVWIDGDWIALDPTLGQGKVGAAHIKISDHHWNDVQSFTPLIPVVRVLGKLHLEIVSVK